MSGFHRLFHWCMNPTASSKFQKQKHGCTIALVTVYQFKIESGEKMKFGVVVEKAPRGLLLLLPSLYRVSW